ncbi:MAG: DUF4097 domain-containing protein [Gemmatimonadota bacterium]|nr:DUF4097 domain-containing protein [Gemmatimonadota bacterium]
MKTTIPLLCAAVAGVWGLSTGVTAVQQDGRFELTGSRIAVYNLAGEVTVEAGSGPAVMVDVTRVGPDADQLRIDRGPIDDWSTLRVIYPGDRVHYSGRGTGSTELRVRDDGTFGGDPGHRGRRVRIVSDKDGLDAHANLTIRVPEGQTFDLYLAVGTVSARNINGRIRLDTHSAPVTTSGTGGHLVVDVGSGRVEASDHEGDLDIDTGSGSVEVSGVRGDVLRVDTGSGGVTATRVSVSNLQLDTGSGGVEVHAAVARDILIDTGTGSVELALSTNPRDVVIDTGSGSVTMTVPESFGAELVIDTGSGGISIDFPVTMQDWERDHVEGTIGDGAARVTIDTGSGSVRILKG